MARLSTKSQGQVQVDDGYLIALAKQGDPTAYDRLVRRYYGFVRLKASSYFLAGGDARRPDPGGPRRPLQGGPRLPHRPRVELPQLRGALHHAPDHHRGQDGDAQQAHAAEPVRLVLVDGRRRRAGRRADARRGASRARPCTTRSTRSSAPRSCARSSGASRRRSPSSSRASCRSTSTAAATRRIGERLGCDTKTVDNALQRVKRKVGAHLRTRDVLSRPRARAATPGARRLRSPA